MAKTNYPEELVSLVQEYLTDGVITAKERQVLTKKAVALGIDADEFDLYLDAQQQKADQEVDAATAKKRGKTCPFCGGTVPQLADKCPHCGETITPEASEELQDILNHLEDALVEYKTGVDAKSGAMVDRYIRKAHLYYGSNPKVKKLLTEIESETAEMHKKSASIERNERFMGFLLNKRIWVYVECLIVGFFLVTSFIKCSEFDSKKDEYQFEDPRRTQYVEKSESALFEFIGAFIFGGIIIGVTAMAANNDKKKKD